MKFGYLHPASQFLAFALLLASISKPCVEEASSGYRGLFFYLIPFCLVSTFYHEGIIFLFYFIFLKRKKGSEGRLEYDFRHGMVSRQNIPCNLLGCLTAYLLGETSLCFTGCREEAEGVNFFLPLLFIYLFVFIVSCWLSPPKCSVAGL